MAELLTTTVFKGQPPAVYKALSQFEKYPEYLQWVTSIDVLDATVEGSLCRVRYELKLIKSFYYTLHMYGDGESKIWWDLDESNIMKANTGSWTFKPKGKTQTEAVYAIDVKFKGFVPQAVTDQIAKANLSLMFESFQKMIDDKN